ncbi:MAG TPA: PaaI family thioesterase [Xanthobacteraceae bacterium]|nr:PaaI family thioesterase [Xanthobacteraceae bacterium]
MIDIAPSNTHSTEDLAREGWSVEPDDGFIGLVGPVWRAPDRFGHRYAFLAESKHRNRRGVVQGGMLMTFADRAMGGAARNNDPAIKQATVQLNVDFIDAAWLGNIVEIDCEVMRRTRTIIFVRGRLFEKQRLIATSHGIWKILA